MESSVAGLPDEKWGEKVVAAVVLKPGSDTDEKTIFEFCKAHLHNWKCPKEIRFVDKLPKNTMGKVLKDQVERPFRGVRRFRFIVLRETLKSFPQTPFKFPKYCRTAFGGAGDRWENIGIPELRANAVD